MFVLGPSSNYSCNSSCQHSFQVVVVIALRCLKGSRNAECRRTHARRASAQRSALPGSVTIVSLPPLPPPKTPGEFIGRNSGNNAGPRSKKIERMSWIVGRHGRVASLPPLMPSMSGSTRELSGNSRGIHVQAKSGSDARCGSSSV